MKWTIYPENKEFTTSLPLTIEISDYRGEPEVTVEKLGELKLNRQADKLEARFYFTLPGEYKLQVTDSNSKEVRVLHVSEHKYLDFGNEFGFFLILFLFVMGGIILWTRKIMLK